jgi:hypothetical protein
MAISVKDGLLFGLVGWYTDRNVLKGLGCFILYVGTIVPRYSASHPTKPCVVIQFSLIGMIYNNTPELCLIRCRFDTQCFFEVEF